jgi:hypothetical protein
LLGGKDNFAADRQLGDQLLEQFPTSEVVARQNRKFMGRAVHYCAGQGIRQFVDLGSGLPTMDNVHEVARRVIPEASVVYADNDKVAHSHHRSGRPRWDRRGVPGCHAIRQLPRPLPCHP